MKKLVLALMMCGLVGCGDGGKSTSEQNAEIAPSEPVVDHYYSMNDGYEYGYEQGLSNDSVNAGQVASTLIMFKYAGVKDGVYQVYTKNNMGAFDVLECTNPCQYLKEMIFYNGSHLKTERIKAVEGSIGWSVMADAINGKMEQFIAEKNNGAKSTVWFNEKTGLKFTSVDK
ncbi:MAG: hypothetical protein Q8J66_09215 [Methylotenera sp.]|nr:hypothetical protein [Methylotenera sp.]